MTLLEITKVFPEYIFLGFASCVLWEVTPFPSPLFRTQKATFRQKCWLFNAPSLITKMLGGIRIEYSAGHFEDHLFQLTSCSSGRCETARPREEIQSPVDLGCADISLQGNFRFWGFGFFYHFVCLLTNDNLSCTEAGTH